MASYRNIQLAFWTDSKVADDFTPEDKYFYLYLLTNPHTNTCGCYELSIRQMSNETGYSQDTIERLIERFALVHNIIRYSKDNKEILVINWHKYNWTTSEKLRVSILNNINSIKTKSYKDYLLSCFNGDEEDEEEIVDSSIEETKDNIILSADDIEPVPEPIQTKASPKPQPQKHVYGEYKHVKLTDEQYTRLIKDYGEEAVADGIRKVDEYCQEFGKRYTDYNLTIRRWGIESPKLKDQKKISDDGQVRRALQ